MADDNIFNRVNIIRETIIGNAIAETLGQPPRPLGAEPERLEGPPPLPSAVLDRMQPTTPQSAEIHNLQVLKNFIKHAVHATTADREALVTTFGRCVDRFTKEDWRDMTEYAWCTLLGPVEVELYAVCNNLIKLGQFLGEYVDGIIRCSDTAFSETPDPAGRGVSYFIEEEEPLGSLFPELDADKPGPRKIMKRHELVWVVINGIATREHKKKLVREANEKVKQWSQRKAEALGAVPTCKARDSPSGSVAAGKKASQPQSNGAAGKRSGPELFAERVKEQKRLERDRTDSHQYGVASGGKGSEGVEEADAPADSESDADIA